MYHLIAATNSKLKQTSSQIHIVEVNPCYEKIFVKNGQCSTTGEFYTSLLFVSDFG
jgi:hypothetical protein